MKIPPPLPNPQSGNVFLFILIGVVLFAALGITVSRGLRSNTTTEMSNREALLAAADILDYAQRLSRAVERLRRKNVSENDISFDNPAVPGYAHTPAQPDAHQVFLVAGGAMGWQAPAPRVNDGSPWFFTGSTCIAGVGTGAAGCSTDSISNEELLAILFNLKQNVCEKINDKLGISGIPTDSGDGFSSAQFTGAFEDDTIVNPGSVYESACISQGGNYYFYHVLIAR
ncbi:MAG: hypothetical protein K9G62_02640 [Alphaproteobacteria bacterium]|nr:hypothetical protein [Alphaproteobacteria bacterium]